MIAVLDFGSQYTQLIAKRLRRLGFATEVLSGRSQAPALRKIEKLAGIILSGSPASVGTSIDPDPEILAMGLPILGICFGYQYLAKRLGGKVEAQKHREYGSATLTRSTAGKSDPLTRHCSDSSIAWMSHGDSVVALPPNALAILESGGRPAAFSIPQNKIWALQFHPEVHHTAEGDRILQGFAEEVCRLKKDWNLKSVLEDLKAKLRHDLKDVPQVSCAVSGGVDSTVMAVLLSEFTQVRALFVDHGFLRSYDLSDLKRVFASHPKIQLEVIDARPAFWKDLKGVSDPEKKRKIAGRAFIESFYDHVVPPDERNAGKKHYLAQGTIYSDVIESAANELAPAEKIKSHHNVGGLPKDLKFELIEPLRNFFKDEVREIGKLLGIDEQSLARHPFPGPGLIIRCIGELSPERIEVLRLSDSILHEELVKRKLYHQTWQALTVLLPISTVGVMGDGRSYESVIAIRAVSSVDAMTAEASEFPWSDLKAIASRIVNEVRGVNRVVFDLTSKPPGTIEWE